MTEAEALQAATDHLMRGMADAWALSNRAKELDAMGLTEDLDGNTKADLLIGSAAHIEPLADLIEDIEDCIMQAKEQDHG